ncbi:hypothetical protein [Streptoalloteichus hindustanus]|nr:hypothetical protein [Streptoalloteichus hindustanus]
MGDVVNTVRVMEHISADVVARMVASWRTGDADGVADGLIALRAAHGGDEVVAVRAASRTVLRGCAVMMLTLASVRGTRSLVRVRLCDPAGREVDPQHGSASLRSLFAALVATVDGDQAAAEATLERVFDSVSAAERNVLLLTLLAWTAALVDACERHRLPRPRWLAGAAAGRDPVLRRPRLRSVPAGVR